MSSGSIVFTFTNSLDANWSLDSSKETDLDYRDFYALEHHYLIYDCPKVKDLYDTDPDMVPEDGNALVWKDATQQWEADTVGAPPGSIPTGNDGDRFVFDATSDSWLAVEHDCNGKPVDVLYASYTGTLAHVGYLRPDTTLNPIEKGFDFFSFAGTFDQSTAKLYKEENGHLYVFGSNVASDTPTMIRTANERTWEEPIDAALFSYTDPIVVEDILLMVNNNNNTLVIKNDGTLWGCGHNQNGELGVGDTALRNVFTQESTLSTDWASIQPINNNGSIFAIKTDGTLWSTGINTNGILGVGDTISRNVFTQESTLGTGWKSVIQDLTYSAIAIKTDGTIWSTGFNGNGQLGVGDILSRNTFTQESTLGTNWAEVWLNPSSSAMALTTNGEIWATGKNNTGQLGVGDFLERHVFTQEVTGITSWTTVVPDVLSFMALTSSRYAFGVGYNGKGQLGTGDTTNKNVFTQSVSDPIGLADIVKLIRINSYTIALTSNGTIWGCGENGLSTYGCGDDTAYHPSFLQEVTYSTDWIDVIAYPNYSTVALKSDGTLWSTGQNSFGQLGVNDNLARLSFTQESTLSANWKSIASFSGLTFSTFAFKTDNTLWSTGYNYYGTLAVGDFLDKNIFTQEATLSADWAEIKVNSNHAIFCLKTDGTMWVAGRNDWGELGTGNLDELNVLTIEPSIGDWGNFPTQIPPEVPLTNINTMVSLYGKTFFSGVPTGIEGVYQLPSSPSTTGLSGTSFNKVSCTWLGTIAIKNDGTMLGAGYNNRGQLGIGNTTSNIAYFTQEINGFNDWTTVSESGNHSGAIRSDGTLWCTGWNTYGQLGVNDTIDRSVFTQESHGYTNWKYVFQAPYRLIAIKDDGTLWQAGRDVYGELATNGTGSHSTFTQEANGFTDWVSVSSAIYQTLAIRSDGTLWGAGYNWNYALGVPDRTPVAIFTQEANGFTDWVKASIATNLGQDHSSAIRANGTLWSCGINTYGQLGTIAGSKAFFTQEIHEFNDWIDVQTTTYCTMGLRANGTLWGTGRNLQGELGVGDALPRYEFTQEISLSEDWVQFSLCGNYTLALKADGTLWAVGNDSYGPLGNGLIGTVYEFGQESNGFTDWILIHSADYPTSVAMRKDGTIWGCGRNATGQLGVGDLLGRDIFTQEIGLSEYIAPVPPSTVPFVANAGLYLTEDDFLSIVPDPNEWGTVDYPGIEKFVISPIEEVITAGGNDYTGRYLFAVGYTAAGKIIRVTFVSSAGYWGWLEVKSALITDELDVTFDKYGDFYILHTTGSSSTITKGSRSDITFTALNVGTVNSTNFITTILSVSEPTCLPVCIAASIDRIIAVGNDATTPIAISFDWGATWGFRDVDPIDYPQPQNLFWNNKRFYSVEANQVRRSCNGIDWSELIPNTNDVQMSDIISANSIYTIGEQPIPT